LALQIFRDLQRTRLHPNIITYTTLISVLGEGNQCNLVLFTDLKGGGFKLDITTFRSLINLMEKEGDWKVILYIFAHLKKKEVKPDTTVYNAGLTVK